MENESKFTHNALGPSDFFCKPRLILTHALSLQARWRDSQRRARIKVTLVGWRKKFIYSSLSVKPPHRKEAAHFIKKQTYKRSSFKKYYKSSLQAVKVKLQSGCYVHKRKQQQPSVQHRELESTEEPEVLVRRTRASTETARGKKKEGKNLIDIRSCLINTLCPIKVTKQNKNEPRCLI